VYELESLSPEALQEVVRRGVTELATELSPELEELIAASRGRRCALCAEHPRARRRHSACRGRRDHEECASAFLS